MEKKQKLCVISLMLLLCVSMIKLPSVKAAPYLIDSFPVSYWTGTFNEQVLHPSTSATYFSADSQSFLCSVSGYTISQAAVYIYKLGSPSGLATVRLYSHQGVFGTSSKPLTLLATSDGIEVSTLGQISPSLVTFTFSGDQEVELQKDTYYCIAYVNPEAGVIDASNYVRIGRDTSNPEDNGNEAYFRNSAWTFFGNDMIYYVWGLPIPEEGGISAGFVLAGVCAFGFIVLPLIVIVLRRRS